MDALAKEALKEERKINSSIRNLTGESGPESAVDAEDIGRNIHNIDEE